MSPWLANSSSISAAVCLLFKISVEAKSFSILNLFLHFLHLFVLKHYRIFVTVMQSKFHCCLKFAMSGTYVLHSLMCVVPRVRGLHYTIVTSTSTLGMDCPTPCISVMNQQCIQIFNCYILFYTLQPCLPRVAPRVITSNNCLVHLPRPSVRVHMLNMTIPTKAPTS